MRLLKQLNRNKRGNIQDFLFFGVVILGLSIMFVIGGVLNTEFGTQMNDSTLSAQSKEIYNDNSSRFNNVFDWIFFFVIILFLLSIIAAMYLLDSNPALFFAVIIIFAFILIVIGALSNTYDKFSDDEDTGAQSQNMPMLDWFMDNYVMVVLVGGFVGIILMFAQVKGFLGG